MKKALSILLCLSLLPLGLAFGAPVQAAGTAANARLYNVYGNGMLFRQNVPALFAGEAPTGTKIAVTLVSAAGEPQARGEATAEQGRFTVGFTAPAGGYETYTVRLTADGAEFAVLQDVVFGELWLASGQSNMQYTLSGTAEGKEMMAAGITGPKDVHVMLSPAPAENGKYLTRYLPQTDVKDGRWFTADSTDVYNMSAVAYHFAVDLQKALDLPVGILNVPLGGSAIAPWISREAIDGCPAVKNRLIALGQYYDESHWADSGNQMHLDMTNLYNTNIAPFTNFRPQGVIWYQGCTEIMLGNTNDYYFDLFTLMQDSYTADFGYEGERLPFIVSHLALYNYGKGPYTVTRFNEAFSSLVAAAPESRAEVPIYDLTLAFNEMGAIHPMTKQPIGERMAKEALGLVYGKAQPGSAPRCVKSEARGGSVYLTFENCGDGLAFNGEVARGFAVCGADGICVPAEAEIVSADTVRVWSADVPAPAAATYAASDWSERANLYSTVNGERYLPAVPTGISDAKVTRPWADNAWTGCEDETFFESDSNPGYVSAWRADGCTLVIDTSAPGAGTGAVKLTATEKRFSASPNVSRTEKLKTRIFDNADADWTGRGTLRLQLKNDGAADVTLSEIRLYTNEVQYYTPVNASTGTPAAAVPADGAWHTYIFDLDRLNPFGAAGIERSNEKLGSVNRITFRFTGENAAVLIDDIRLLPGKPAETAKPGAAVTVFSWIKWVARALTECVRALMGTQE